MCVFRVKNSAVIEEKKFELSFDLKSVSDTGEFEGYGSIFNNVDLGLDRVRPGAFMQSVKERMPALLWQHEMKNPIGIYTEVREDGRGLYVKGQLNLDTQQGREAHSLMKQGALKGLSIGYRAKEFAFDEDTGVRDLLTVDLFEISPVTFPMNELAGVTGVKKQPPQTARELEQFLRDAGFSKSQAKGVASEAKKFLFDRRDADVKEAETSTTVLVEDQLRRLFQDATEKFEQI